MRNTELEKLDGLVGEWTTTISDAWFLEPPGATVPGSTIVEWIGESFLVLRSKFAEGQHAHSEMTLVLGRSDPNNAYIALYHDDRGVCRVYAMTLDGAYWTMTREDPDMHQRFIADIETDRIRGRWEASDDQGNTWRKDFDLTYERTQANPV
jgi:hypothetical protein